MIVFDISSTELVAVFSRETDGASLPSSWWTKNSSGMMNSWSFTDSDTGASLTIKLSGCTSSSSTTILILDEIGGCLSTIAGGSLLSLVIVRSR